MHMIQNQAHLKSLENLKSDSFNIGRTALKLAWPLRHFLLFTTGGSFEDPCDAGCIQTMSRTG